MKLFNEVSWVAKGCAIVTGVAFLSGCLDQFDPRKDWQMFQDERVNASRPVERLTESGELAHPFGQDGSSAVAVARAPEAVYGMYCSSCHGNAGGGDGPGAVALNPKPRNLQDASWHASVDDQHIYKVIAQGGASVGLSPYMAAFGGMISEEEITSLVGFIRTLAKN